MEEEAEAGWREDVRVKVIDHEILSEPGEEQRWGPLPPFAFKSSPPLMLRGCVESITHLPADQIMWMAYNPFTTCICCHGIGSHAEMRPLDWLEESEDDEERHSAHYRPMVLTVWKCTTCNGHGLHAYVSTS